MDLPTSRSEALALGSGYYLTGRHCLHGHVSKYRTAQGDCYQCHIMANVRRAAKSAKASKAAKDFKEALSRLANDFIATITHSAAPQMRPVDPTKRKFQNV